MLSAVCGVLLATTPAARAAEDVDALQVAAFEAYANRDFQETVGLLTRILNVEPKEARWYEMRAQVLVDGKNFQAALEDYATAIELTPADSELVVTARLLAGRGLAEEGVSDWRGALQDYDRAMELADKGGESPDPYVVNSRGNCYNSLGMWAEARADYLASSQLFQQAKGLIRGTQRLDGAIFSASNAALMLAEMGDLDGALKEMKNIARRAPGSADMRAALAALYYAKGQRDEAESAWEFACVQINVGCSKYQDVDWLRRIRRWPPTMVAKMQDFVRLKSPLGLPAAPAASLGAAP
ncbi:MAG: hypothetical protein WDW38_008917 [Sanguina aurantia]